MGGSCAELFAERGDPVAEKAFFCEMRGARGEVVRESDGEVAREALRIPLAGAGFPSNPEPAAVALWTLSGADVVRA